MIKQNKFDEIFEYNADTNDFVVVMEIARAYYYKKEFQNILKGSGYTYLVFYRDELNIVNLYNQENPYYFGMIPLIALDMWEHAYYINYENKKDIYIDNFFEIMDFKYANSLF